MSDKEQDNDSGQKLNKYGMGFFVYLINPDEGLDAATEFPWEHLSFIRKLFSRYNREYIKLVFKKGRAIYPGEEKALKKKHYGYVIDTLKQKDIPSPEGIRGVFMRKHFAVQQGEVFAGPIDKDWFEKLRGGDPFDSAITLLRLATHKYKSPEKATRVNREEIEDLIEILQLQKKAKERKRKKYSNDDEE